MGKSIVTKLLIVLSFMFAGIIASTAFCEQIFADEVKRGDFNNDGFVDADDAVYLLFSTLYPDQYKLNQDADFTRDGYVDSNDAVYLLMYTIYPNQYPLDEIKKEIEEKYTRQDLYPGVDNSEKFVKETVEELQGYLIELGYKEPDTSEITIDGIYDQDMVDVVYLFQQINGDSNPDGCLAVGRWTWGVIDNLIYEKGRGNYTVPKELTDYYDAIKKAAEEEKKKEETPKEEVLDIYNGRVNIYYGIPSNEYVKKTVLELQKALNILGFTDNSGRKLSEDGEYGPNTYAAVLKFQTVFDFGADGVLSNRGWTWSKIDSLIEERSKYTDVSEYAAGSLSNCGKDENNKYHGGVAGDQTGAEFRIVGWYNYPWDYILRYEGERAEEVRALITQYAVAAALNDHIGYDQDQRGTFWTELTKCGYDPANITNNCEADCSSSVASIVRAVGYTLGIDKFKNIDLFATFTEGSQLASVGFTMYESSEYTASSQYLLAGDVLLNVQNHTTICIKNGSSASSQPSGGTTSTVLFKVKVTTQSDNLNIRSGAGTSYGIKGQAIRGSIYSVTKTASDSSGMTWYYLSELGGWGRSDYLTRQ